MAEDESGVVETEWERVSDKHFKAILRLPQFERRYVQEFLICEYQVVEVDKLFEEGEPRAVFRESLTSEQLPEIEDLNELEEYLREMAFDAPELQVREQFEASVEAFESV